MMSVLVCPDPTVLEALATGSVAEADRRSLESHLDTCADCSEVVAELARIFADSGADVTIEAASGDGESMKPPPGELVMEQTLGRYQLGRRLGVGGMGVVFEARDPELDRLVAIKLLHGGRGAAALEARLLREARAMARLQHPNVVAVHDIGSVGDKVFIAMELVEGTTLSQWMAERGRSTREVVRVFAEAGRGLAAAHEMGMVHRDFKPDNVLIGADGRSRVTDFGLARPFDEAPVSVRGSAPDPTPITTGMSLTRTAPSAIVGTPAYMSPEQLEAKTADARSDQFAFCVALFEALVGRRPFEGASFEELARNVVEGKRQPTPSTVPRWLRSIIDRGLQANATSRYPSMAALLSDLERDRGQLRRAVLTGGAMVVAAAATVGVLYFWTGLTTPEAAEETAASLAATSPIATCKERSLVKERWSKARQDAFRVALSKRAISDEQLARGVMKEAEMWTAAWSKEHLRTCRMKDDVERARLTTCLTRRFRAFDAIAAHVIDSEDGYANEQALAALGELTSPERCQSEARLAVQPSTPSAETAPAVAKVVADMDALGAALALGQARYQRDAAAKLVEDAKATGHVPTQAEAVLLRGRVLHALGEPDLAATTLEEAVAIGRAANHDEAVSEAAATLADIEVERLRPKAVKRWLRILEADATRFDDRPLEAEAALVKGRMIRSRGDYKDAHDPLRKALNLSRSAFGDAHPRTARAYVAYSDLLVDLGRIDEAVGHARTAVKIGKEVAGDRNLVVARARMGLGRALLAKGEAQAALQEFELAEGAQSLGTRFDRGRDHVNLSRDGMARAHEMLGNLDKAEKELDSAELARRNTWQHAISLTSKGEFLIRKGERDQGLKLLAQAVSELEKRFGETDMRLVFALRALGRGQTAAKKYTVARKTFERALAIIEQELGYEPLRAFVHEELAEVERVAKQPKARLKHLDAAFVLLSSAYGHDHERCAYNVLARADVAYDVGRKAYAGRLYRSSVKRLTELVGAEHPDTVRATERATPPEEDDKDPPVPQTRATDVKKELRERIREIQEDTAEKVNRKLDGE